MNILKKIWNIIVKILLLIIFVIISFIIYGFISISLFHNDYVNYFGYTYFCVGSGSMNPVIQSNDIVIVKIDGDYQLNDIVTYPFENEYITHRIVEIRDDVIITKGDTNRIKDVPINKDYVIGRVVFVWHNGGLIKRVLLTPRVLVSFIITMLLFSITYSYDKDLFKKFRMRKLSKKKISEYKKKIRERKRKEREKKIIKNKKTKVVSKKKG